MTEEDLAALQARPDTWVSLAVLKVVDDEDLVAEHLEEALQFHRSVSGPAAAHLGLLADNTFRTPWLAAKLLSKDKNLARDAARALLRHLAKYKVEQQACVRNEPVRRRTVVQLPGEFCKLRACSSVVAWAWKV